MLTFKPLDVYDVVDPDESLVEALREYPELREFENVLTEGEEDQEPRETPKESTLPVGKADYRAILEAGRRGKFAKQDSPAPRVSWPLKAPRASLCVWLRQLLESQGFQPC